MDIKSKYLLWVEAVLKNKVISLILGIAMSGSVVLGSSIKVQATTTQYIEYNRVLSQFSNEEGLRTKIDRDARNSVPHRFRMCTQKIDGPNLKGLEELNISGSGQLTINGLINMKKELPSNNVLVLDLREESHLLVDGEGISGSKAVKGQYAVSWAGEKGNSANKGKSDSEIAEDESMRRQELLSSKSMIISDNDNGYSSIEKIKKVQTEEEIVKSIGYNYYRIPVTDEQCPTDEDVDNFVSLVKNLPSHTWVHFHCLAGKGRTTTFMIMYDMMRNAKDVSFDDIVNRQILIGGYDKVIVGTSASKERAKFLKVFYKYCHENKDNFKTLWTQR